MAEGGFDPCECIWSHEMAMKRLMALLRQSQSYCTEEECFTDVPGPSGGAGDNSFMLMMMAWAALAFLMFMIRPAALRNSGDSKPANQGPGNGNDPPAPGVH